MKHNEITINLKKIWEALPNRDNEIHGINISHVYRDLLKKNNQLKEIDRLEKALGVKIIFTRGNNNDTFP